MASFTSRFTIVFFGHAGNAGNECADVAAAFGLNGFTSECNVPSFLAYEAIFGATPF